MGWIFQDSLNETASLLREQLEMAKAKESSVQVSSKPPYQAKSLDM
jgi:hypothetical protein